MPHDKVGVLVRRFTFPDVTLGVAVDQAIKQYNWSIEEFEIVEPTEYPKDQLFAKVLSSQEIYMMLRDFADQVLRPELMEMNADKPLSHFWSCANPAIYINVDMVLPVMTQGEEPSISIGSLAKLKEGLEFMLSRALDENYPVEPVFFLKDYINAIDMAIQNGAYLAFGTTEHPIFRQAFTNILTASGDTSFNESNY